MIVHPMLRGPGVLLFCCVTLHAQERGNWQVLAQLHPGDRVTVAVKARGSKKGIFQSWDADQIHLESATVRREEVQTVARQRAGGWGRGKTALLGAGIGGAIGAGVRSEEHTSELQSQFH